jgi:hypothetical protein
MVCKSFCKGAKLSSIHNMGIDENVPDLHTCVCMYPHKIDSPIKFVPNTLLIFQLKVS